MKYNLRILIILFIVCLLIVYLVIQELNVLLSTAPILLNAQSTLNLTADSQILNMESCSSHDQTKEPKNLEKLRVRDGHTPFLLLEDIDFNLMEIYNKQDRNDFKYVFGIPTVRRKSVEGTTHSYFHTTLKSLFTKSQHASLGEVLFLIYVADIFDVNQCQVILKETTMFYLEMIEKGLIEIICPHPYMYPDIDSMKVTLGDSRERFNWRTKQTLDYAFMMAYGCNKGQYYMQLEDDQEVAYGYIEQIDSFVNSLNFRFSNWQHALFSHYGFIAILMKSSDALALSQYLLLKFTNQPCDWLFKQYQQSSICYFELDHEECLQLMYKDAIFYFNPSLFKHIGDVSSLPGQDRMIGNENYEDIKPIYVNPLARLSTNFLTESSNVVSKVYLGIGEFFASKVNKNNYIMVKFIKHQSIREIIVQTGTLDFPNDILSNGIIQYRELITVNNTLIVSKRFYLCDLVNGQAHCSFPYGMAAIEEIRILATEEQIQWVRFSILEIK